MITDVVLVCSPPIVATAKGSGNPARQMLVIEASARFKSDFTKDITLVEAVGGDDYLHISSNPNDSTTKPILVTRRFGVLTWMSAELAYTGWTFILR